MLTPTLSQFIRLLPLMVSVVWVGSSLPALATLASTHPLPIQPTQVAQVFENQGVRAKQAEARQYVGSLNRSQQAQYLERGRFSTSFKELGVWIQPETENYRYHSVLIPFNRLGGSASGNRAVMNLGITKKVGLKSYAGIVWVGLSDRGMPRTFAVICESLKPTANTPGLPSSQGNGNRYSDITCPAGYTRLQ